jgi:hypothetical protein
MTRVELLLSGRVAIWMDGVESGYSVKTADPLRYALSKKISKGEPPNRRSLHCASLRSG